MRHQLGSYEVITVIMTLVVLALLHWSVTLYSSIDVAAITNQTMVNQSTVKSTIDLFNTTNFQAVPGAYRISFSGSVIGASGSDTISIDFGDGTNGTTSINGTTWGPTSHIYDIASNQSVPTKVVARLISNDPGCFGCVIAISKPLDLPLAPRHRTLIDVSLPDDIVSGTSITLMGKLFDVDVIPPAEIPDKEIKFSGPGARSSWDSVITRTGGFTFSDPTGLVHIERCIACDPDPESSSTTGNMFLALHVGSDIFLPSTPHGLKLSLLNLEGTHYDIEITKGDGESTIVSEADQLLNNTRTNLNMLFPEGIERVSLISNAGTVDGSQVGILRLQIFDPAGDPEEQTSTNFEEFITPAVRASPLSMEDGSFRFTGNAIDPVGIFNVNVRFRGDSDYIPATTQVHYRSSPATFGTAGEPAIVTDYIGTVWTSLPNVCGTGPDTDQDGICDSWESQTTPGNDLTHRYISCPKNTDNSFMDPLCTSSTAKFDLCITDAFSYVWGGGTGLRICPTVGHKDIYVEIDYMEGHRPDPISIENVIKSFGNAPFTGSPDGFSRTQGVTLHIMLDEQLLHVTPLNIWQDPAGSACGGVNGADCNNDNDYRHIKEGTVASSTDGHFGTLSDRSLGAIALNMKHYVYHYGIFAHSIGSACGPSGLAEVRGNDFIVSLGCMFGERDSTHTGTEGTTHEQAGTLMHELGHNFNLDHGGLRSSFLPYNVGSINYNMNCKPNYLSVMSYSRQVPISSVTENIWGGTPTSKSFLDYSNHGYWSNPGWSISDLIESSLSETSGLTTQDRQQIVYGTPGLIPAIRISPTNLAGTPNLGINWNGNAGMDSGTVSMDINQLSSFTGCPGTPSQTEKGYDDWLIMTLKFLDDADSRDGVGGDPRKLPELTPEILAAFRAGLNQFVGPDSPNKNGSSVYILNTTVPVKFQLRDINGSFVKNADVSFNAKKLSANVSGTHLEIANVTIVPSTGNHFNFNNITNQYIYNWGTKNLTQGEYGLKFILNANSSKPSLLQGIGEIDISTRVGLKKP